MNIYGGTIICVTGFGIFVVSAYTSGIADHWWCISCALAVMVSTGVLPRRIRLCIGFASQREVSGAGFIEFIGSGSAYFRCR